MYPNSVKNLIDCFKDLPGIGEKTAERLVFSLIGFNKEKLTSFSDSLIIVRDKLTNCSICGNITENDICDICLDSNRNSKIIFIHYFSKSLLLFLIEYLHLWLQNIYFLQYLEVLLLHLGQYQLYVL